jgi:hypothetical protein
MGLAIEFLKGAWASASWGKSACQVAEPIMLKSYPTWVFLAVYFITWIWIFLFPFFFFFFPTFNCDECIILEIWQVEVSYPGWPRWEYLGVWTNLPLWFNFIVQILVCSSPTSNLGGKQFLSCGDSIGWFLTCFKCNFCALLSKSAVSCQFCIIGGVPDSFSRKEKPQITGFMRFTCIVFPGFLKVNSIKLFCESVRSMLLFLTSFINQRLC